MLNEADWRYGYFIFVVSAINNIRLLGSVCIVHTDKDNNIRLLGSVFVLYIRTKITTFVYWVVCLYCTYGQR